MAESTGPFAVCARAMSLRCVFDHHQSVACSYFADRSHVGQATVEVDRNDGARAWRDGTLDRSGVERERTRTDVGENGHATGVDDGERRVGGRERRRDDLIARPLRTAPLARSASVSASVPEATVTAPLTPQKAAHSRSKASTSRPRTYSTLAATRRTASSTSRAISRCCRERSRKGTPAVARWQKAASRSVALALSIVV